MTVVFLLILVACGFIFLTDFTVGLLGLFIVAAGFIILITTGLFINIGMTLKGVLVTRRIGEQKEEKLGF